MVKKAVLILCLIMPISHAANTPCSGSKGGILRCDGTKFVCNDGSMSASKLDCSVVHDVIISDAILSVDKQRVIQCFLDQWIIHPQLTWLDTKDLCNINTNTP